MILSKEISQFFLPDEIFYLLLQTKTIVYVMPMVFVEVVILVPIALVGISLHFFRLLQGRIILDLHENLFKQHVQGRVLLTSCQRARLLVISIFLLSRSCLLWSRTLLSRDGPTVGQGGGITFFVLIPPPIKKKKKLV